MAKILIGLIAALVIAAGGFFGFEFYVQHRVAGEVEAAFEQIRAAGAKASHGKVSFDPRSHTIAIADIAAESAAQPPVSVKIASFVASGVSRPDATRFFADNMVAENVEFSSIMPMQAGLHGTYRAPRIDITAYSGPTGPMRQFDNSSPTDIYRLIVEQFSAVTAASISAPSLTVSMTSTAGSPPISGSGEYIYTNLAMRDIKDGKIATSTIDRISLAASIDVAGKTGKMTGELNDAVFYDFDAAATAAILDPARAKDDNYYRMYRQGKTGVYTVSLQHGPKFRIENLTFNDIGVRPSRMQLPMLIALMGSAPPSDTQPTPAQTRAILEKVAGIYEGVRVGNAEMRGLSVETPEGPFKLAAIRFNLENGKIGEFALEGLDAHSPQGPVRIGRFALKSLDIANLSRMSSQFSNPAHPPSLDQLFGLLPLLEGAEIKEVVAPYKDSTAPVKIENLSLDWGQFVGPVPSKARLTLKMSTPIDAADPTQQMLIAAGISTAAINLDVGAAWTEDSRSFVLGPVTAELGGVLSASAHVSLDNVPREVFSTNPLQAAVMAAQIEAGTIEIALRDSGGVDLAVAQFARMQNVSRDAARRAIIDNINAGGASMATTSPDAMAITNALTDFIANPSGTLTVTLTPRGKVPAIQLVGALKSDPLAALARFRAEASTGR